MSKRALYEMLSNAVRNTTAIAEGKKPIPDSQAKACPENAAMSPPVAAEGMKQAASRLSGGRTPEGEVANRPPHSFPNLSTMPAKHRVAFKLPTADDIARAIVAAARETNEIDRVTMLDQPGTLRCRHYAMHALVHCFPGHTRKVYAKWVGAPGQPTKFFDNSKAHIVAMRGPIRRRAPWWSESAYGRVIAAIEGS